MDRASSWILCAPLVEIGIVKLHSTLLWLQQCVGRAKSDICIVTFHWIHILIVGSSHITGQNKPQTTSPFNFEHSNESRLVDSRQWLKRERCNLGLARIVGFKFVNQWRQSASRRSIHSNRPHKLSHITGSTPKWCGHLMFGTCD